MLLHVAGGSAAIDFICADCSRVTIVSTALKSAGACTGAVRRQSCPGLHELQLRIVVGDLESIDLLAVEREDLLVAGRTASDRGCSPVRRNQEDLLLAGPLRVEIAACRRLAADEEAPVVLVARRLERNLEPRLVEPMRLHVGRLVHHVLHFNRREVARDSRDLALVDFGRDRLQQLPAVLAFFSVDVSPDELMTLSSWILSPSTVKTLSRFSAPSSVTGFFASTKYRYATSPPNATKARAASARSSSASPPPAPRRARTRHPESRATPVGDVPLRLRAQRQATVLRVARPDRDEVLLLREPADRVQEQVLVALDAEPPFEAKSESPMAHPRLGLGRIRCRGLAVLRLGRGHRRRLRRGHRDGSRGDTGPWTSLSLSNAIGCCVKRAARSVSPQLCGELSTNVCAVRPLVPPEIGRIDRASG